jgi:hypothetical protein
MQCEEQRCSHMLVQRSYRSACHRELFQAGCEPGLRTSRKEAWGRDILAISALVIVLMAPLGAVAITTAGPLLLRKD